MEMTKKVNAFGKINLGLDVLRRKENGYHEVRMIMQTVGVSDTLTFTVTAEPGIRLETNTPEAPADENNLIWKAVKLLMDEFHIEKGLEISLEKRIPVAAGMAGGSTDAAAALKTVNELFDLGLSQEALMERGVKLGADIPYCILQGTALSEGIGEILTPMSAAPNCHLLIVKPGIGVSTAWVYKNLHANDLKPEQHPDIDILMEAIEEKDIRKLAKNMGNVLELVTIPAHPVIAQIKEKMLELGAEGSLMSGSGPTVFGIFTEKTTAEQAYRAFNEGEASGLASQVYLTDFIDRQ